MHSTECTSILFNLFILFSHLMLPRNSSYLVCFLHIWPDPEQCQGKTQRSFSGLWKKLVSFAYSWKYQRVLFVRLSNDMNQS